MLIDALSLSVNASELVQIPGVIHVHTTFSSGSYTLKELVDRAKTKGLEVLVITDHDLVAMEYGFFPFRNILKKRVEKKSVLKIGPEKYLKAITDINESQSDVVVIPGVQSSPFYYWTGSPFRGDLTAHDYRKELLLIGMTNPEDYRNLPVLHRGFSTRYFIALLPQSIILLSSFIFSLFLIFQKGTLRAIGVLICAFALISAINYHPFQSSRFDPYHGDQGIEPYQEVIDYVRDRDGLVFWAHPEAKYAQQGVKIGNITLQTKPYPYALLLSENYTGFSALYGEWTTVDDPGKQWDQALLEYCDGKREQPVWIIAEADFHKDRNDGGVLDLDSYQTIFLVEKKNMKQILGSLSTGKIYAVRKGDKGRLSLDRFQIGSKGSKVKALMGERLNNPSIPIINIRISASDGGQYPINMTLIRGGKVLKTFDGKTPYELVFEDNDSLKGITYYRLEATAGPMGTVLSNPIFVSKSATMTEQSRQ